MEGANATMTSWILASQDKAWSVDSLWKCACRRTITKSDLLGHLLPMISYDWAHSGITHLFHNIQVRPQNIVSACLLAVNSSIIERLPLI